MRPPVTGHHCPSCVPEFWLRPRGERLIRHGLGTRNSNPTAGHVVQSSPHVCRAKGWRPPSWPFRRSHDPWAKRRTPRGQDRDRDQGSNRPGCATASAPGGPVAPARGLSAPAEGGAAPRCADGSASAGRGLGANDGGCTTYPAGAGGGSEGRPAVAPTHPELEEAPGAEPDGSRAAGRGERARRGALGDGRIDSQGAEPGSPRGTPEGGEAPGQGAPRSTQERDRVADAEGSPPREEVAPTGEEVAERRRPVSPGSPSSVGPPWEPWRRDPRCPVMTGSSFSSSTRSTTSAGASAMRPSRWRWRMLVSASRQRPRAAPAQRPASRSSWDRRSSSSPSATLPGGFSPASTRSRSTWTSLPRKLPQTRA